MSLTFTADVFSENLVCQNENMLKIGHIEHLGGGGTHIGKWYGMYPHNF